MKLIYTIHDFHSEGEGLLNTYQAANAANEKLAKWKIASGADILEDRIAAQETEIKRLKEAITLALTTINALEKGR